MTDEKMIAMRLNYYTRNIDYFMNEKEEHEMMLENRKQDVKMLEGLIAYNEEMITKYKEMLKNDTTRD